MLRRSWAAVAAAAAGLCISRAGWAQAPASRDAAPGRVLGVVFDSLLGRPLAGAEVWLHGAGRMVRSGADGRFVLDSVAPGAQAVGASHAALDSLGLPSLAVSAAVPPGGDAAVTLATPARPRLVGLLCGAPVAAAPARGRAARRGAAPPAGVLVGAVRDARVGAEPVARLAGALVTARYVVEAPDGRGLPSAGEVGARTDSTGAYVLCGLPAGTELVVRAAAPAAAGDAESGPAYVTLGERGVAHLDLALDPTAAPAAAAGTVDGNATGVPTGAAEGAPNETPGPTARGRATLVGVVRDTAGAPRPGTRVRVAGRPDLEVRADSLGRFALAGLARGTQTLVLNAIGYAPQSATVDVRGDVTDTAWVVLQRVVQLTGVTARGRRTTTRLAFRDELARRRRLGGGFLIDSAALARYGTLRGALVNTPFVRVTGTPAQWSVELWSAPKQLTRISSTCEPEVWLDDNPAPGDILSALPAEQILAVEVYRRPNQVPTRYLSHVKGHCGVILVWSAFR